MDPENKRFFSGFFFGGGVVGFCALMDNVNITPKNVCFTVGFNNVEGDRLLHYIA